MIWCVIYTLLFQLFICIFFELNYFSSCHKLNELLLYIFIFFGKETKYAQCSLEFKSKETNTITKWNTDELSNRTYDTI